jgi:hypothetical protein
MSKNLLVQKLINNFIFKERLKESTDSQSLKGHCHQNFYFLNENALKTV